MAEKFSLRDLSANGPKKAVPAPRTGADANKETPGSGADQSTQSTDLAVIEQPLEKEGGHALARMSKESALTVRNEMFSVEEMETILLDLGVKPKHVHVALSRAQRTREPLAQIMRDFGFLSSEGVAQAVSRQTGFQYFPSEAIDNIRRTDLHDLELPEFRRFVPVGRRRDGTLLLAVPDANQVNDARNMFHRMKTEIVIASEHTIQTVYRKFFARTEDAYDRAVAQFEEASRVTRRTEEDDSTLGLVRQIYFLLLRHACYSGASDLQMYRSEYVGIIRLKVNGVGQIFRTVSIDLYKRLVNKLVQDNGAKRDELRVRPKEAVVEFNEEDKKEFPDIATRFGFRLELAMSRGEVTAVTRILDQNSAATDFKKLPFDQETRDAIMRIMRRSHGFFIVTGPTGSGKTTTLYSCLKEVDAVDRSVQSVENPIEYRHGLWMQYEVRKDSQNEGDEYHKMVKMLLRNAPDVVLIGEVRDKEVANACIDASNTGHLVLATLHTNDAALAVARLKSLKVDPNLLGNVLLGILAQRLVRTLCDDCALPDPSEDTRKALEEPYLANVMKRPRRAGEGCVNCDYTGYRGRRMIYELMEVDRTVKELIESDAGPTAIAGAGLSEDKSIWARGIRLVAEGLTSLHELEQMASKSI
jgi:type II secretory ATPase GspE/PulE/Tfp pilus assembly ATPase PilB-like protein